MYTNICCFISFLLYLYSFLFCMVSNFGNSCINILRNLFTTFNILFIFVVVINFWKSDSPFIFHFWSHRHLVWSFFSVVKHNPQLSRLSSPEFFLSKSKKCIPCWTSSCAICCFSWAVSSYRCSFRFSTSTSVSEYIGQDYSCLSGIMRSAHQF